MRIEFLCLLAACAPAWAAGISVYPRSVHLLGANATQVLVVNEGDRDITAECSFHLSNAAIASVSKDARLTASRRRENVADRQMQRRARFGSGHGASAGEKPKLSFVKDVVPIFTMGGCAGSNCHGSIRGQKGFKLSLFGYEPDIRLRGDPAAHRPRQSGEEPDSSKPTFQTQHGGGFRFAVGSLEYRTILEWIEGGATYDSAGSPRIASLSVFPEERILAGTEPRISLWPPRNTPTEPAATSRIWSNTLRTTRTWSKSRRMARSRLCSRVKPRSWCERWDRRSPPRSMCRSPPPVQTSSAARPATQLHR